MARSLVLAAIGILCIVASFVQVNSLKCWTCSSKQPNMDFCKDTFKPDKLNETTKQHYFKECMSEADMGPNYRHVCRKLVKETFGKIITERRCYEAKNYGTPTEQECVDGTNAPAPNTHEKIIFCGTCTDDGCNGAAAFTPILTLLLVPVAVAKIISF